MRSGRRRWDHPQLYFPSANEELIEDVLRKIAADQNNGYYPSCAESSVVQGGDG